MPSIGAPFEPVLQPRLLHTHIRASTPDVETGRFRATRNSTPNTLSRPRRAGSTQFRKHPQLKTVNTPWWRWGESNPRPMAPQQVFSGRILIYGLGPINHSGKLMVAQSLFDFPPIPVTGTDGDPPSDAGSRPEELLGRRLSYSPQAASA
jgi:hypothetical protein